MNHHRNEAIEVIQGVEEGPGWTFTSDPKLAILLAQAHALLYVGDQIAESNRAAESRARTRAHDLAVGR